jgi:hypothetical protein
MKLHDTQQQESNREAFEHFGTLLRRAIEQVGELEAIIRVEKIPERDQEQIGGRDRIDNIEGDQVENERVHSNRIHPNKPPIRLVWEAIIERIAQAVIVRQSEIEAKLERDKMHQEPHHPKPESQSR